MSIFSRSSTSLRSNPHGLRAGFSLVELLISIVILGLILTTVVIRFTSFDSLILLRTIGQEVALTVRKAQTYSLSVLGSNGNFDSPYGVSFTPGENTYPLFKYGGSDARPKNNASATAVETFALGQNFTIADVCVRVSGSASEDCSMSRLDISFERPEFSGLFYVPSYSEAQNASIETGIIKIAALRDDTVMARIEVGFTGQITVILE